METAKPNRITSLDQFRGYTVAGMFLVNFIGGYAVVPYIFKHHNTFCSYADTIMPQFFFAVGFAFRMTYLRRIEKEGLWPAVRHAVSRNIALILIGIVLYGLADKEYDDWAKIAALPFHVWIVETFTWSTIQTLIHIAITSFWILPVIAAPSWVLVAFLVASGAGHALISHLWYYDWTFTTSIVDGGPLGFLTWTIPTLVGALAFDAMAARGPRASIRPIVAWAAVLMVAGYAISCLNARTNEAIGNATGLRAWLAYPPFVQPPGPDVWKRDMWIMSQRAGSVSYQTFAAGFSLAVYAFFVLVSDLGNFQVGVFRTFGQNALAGYILHGMIGEVFEAFTPRNSPGWAVALAFVLFFFTTWLFMRHLEKHKLYLRL